MKITHPDHTPSLVYANKKGEIKDFPGLMMAGRSGRWYFRPEPEDLIPLPEGSELFVLPQRDPIGIDPASGEPVILDYSPDSTREGIQAVAAFMAPAYTAIHTAAYEKQLEAPPLPLFAYTAVGWYKGKFWVCGFRSDYDNRQDFSGISISKIRKKTNKYLKKYPENRLIQHLGKCSLIYSCPAAKNLFLNRFEAPLPTSPSCNANCIGCISLQPSGCCPATQDRIKFIPTPNEITQVAVNHLKTANQPVASFGQGCEGEPLLQAKNIEKAIIKIRKQTDSGTINLNTNAGLPDEVERLAHAGLDSMRVSMNSARPLFHKKYYRAKDFKFKNIRESIGEMKSKQKFVSLNYFILPGFTDDPEEFEDFCFLVENLRPDLIQLRNLNMDPDWYFDELPQNGIKPPMGIRNWLQEVKRRFDWIKTGYFNPCLKTAQK
jgi:molybdenum cofactor biosynthesis enzyme MoaA